MSLSNGGNDVAISISYTTPSNDDDENDAVGIAFVKGNLLTTAAKSLFY
jgi:hypothetical protein